MMCSVMNSRGSKIRMAGKAPSSHLQSVPSSNKSSAANSALNDNAHDEDDVGMNMNSHNGSPSSNSSSHSDQGSPSQNLQPQMYSSSSNKKSASSKKFADEPKQDTNIDSPTNQSHKIIPKTAHKKHRISDKSDSDNSDFDEGINDRDTQGLSKMQKGLKTAAADNTENLCRSRPQSPSYNPNKVTNSSSASTPPKMVSPIPISSNISGSPNNQSSLRVFRNLSSKQPQTQQILKNNNNNQRSSSRTASSPSSPDTSSPLREPDNIINNSPLDFTSKKAISQTPSPYSNSENEIGMSDSRNERDCKHSSGDSSSNGTGTKNISDNTSQPMVPASSAVINLVRRHGDVRKSSSSGSSTPPPPIPGLPSTLSSGIAAVGGLHSNFLPSSVLPGGGQHIFPPPLLLMSSMNQPGSPPISTSPPNPMQANNKHLVRPHAHRYMPTSSHVPSIPSLSSNPYLNMQEKLDNFDDRNQKRRNTRSPSPDGDEAPSNKKAKRGLMGFSIDDILSHKTAAMKEHIMKEHEQMMKFQQQLVESSSASFVRPWDLIGKAAAGVAAAHAAAHAASQRNEDEDEDDEDDDDDEDDVDVDGDDNITDDKSGKGTSRRKSVGDSPLDALFQMASKTFEGLKAKSELDPSQLSFSSKNNSKKKRKSRTAFTNHQIFELEKRFLYQKYLSPADRDEIASHLGLTNAQVITWFQNRRAKLKRDMEELRKDVECTSNVIPQAMAAAAQAGRGPGQVVAAVQAALASRNLAAANLGLPGGHHPPISMASHQQLMLAATAASSKFPLHLHPSQASHHPHSPQPPSPNIHPSMLRPPLHIGPELSHGLMSPASRSDRSGGERSPPIRVTDSDG